MRKSVIEHFRVLINEIKVRLTFTLNASQEHMTQELLEAFRRWNFFSFSFFQDLLELSCSQSNPANCWPYTFRSRGTTSAWMHCHVLGYLCREKRNHIYGQSDLGSFRHSQAWSFLPSIFEKNHFALSLPYQSSKGVSVQVLLKRNNKILNVLPSFEPSRQSDCYLSTHFFAGPSTSRGPGGNLRVGLGGPGHFSVVPAEIRDSNKFLFSSRIFWFFLHSR